MLSLSTPTLRRKSALPSYQAWQYVVCWQGSTSRQSLAVSFGYRTCPAEDIDLNQQLLSLSVGQLYSNEEIFRALGVGNAGGVRVKLAPDGTVLRAALFTSIPTPRQLLENPYVDRLEGDVLVYTGTGLSGDQNLAGTNARLPQQAEWVFPVYGFVQVANRRSISHGNRRWKFIGLLDFLRHYQESQLDSQGQRRAAWVFELLVHQQPNLVEISSDQTAAERARSTDGGVLKLTDREIPDLAVIESSPGAQRSADALEQIRKRLLAMDPRGFELFIRDLLVRSGFAAVEVTRFSQDGGIDLNAKPNLTLWPIRQVMIQIQAKRWLHTVGRKEVAELRGSMQPHAAGCIVTTSHFSKAALVEASEPGKVPIMAINGHELASWAQDFDFQPP